MVITEEQMAILGQTLERAAIAVLEDLRRAGGDGFRQTACLISVQRAAVPDCRLGRVNRALRSERSLPGGAAVVLLVLCLREVVASPAVVLAGQGDFDRILAPLGLRSTGPPFSLPYSWLHYVDGRTTSAGHYLTSYLPLAGLASLAAHTVLSGSIDIRVLGVAYSVLLAASVYMLCRNLKHRGAQVVAAGLLVVGLCDSRLVAYFNTWYEEPWSLLVLIWVPIVITGARHKESFTAKRRLALTVLCCLLVTAKSQDALLAMPLAVAVIAVGRPRGPFGRLRRQRLCRFGCGIAVAMVGLSYLALQSPVYGNESQYDLIFDDLLVHQPEPGSVLKALGLPVQTVAFRGTNAYERSSAFHSPAFQHFEQHGGKERVLLYLAVHPGEAFGLLSRGMRLGWRARLDYLGYYTANSHSPPYGDACEPCLYSTTTQGLSGAGIWLTPGLYALALLIAGSARRTGNTELSDALLVLVGVSIIALCAAVFGEGSYEEIKHLYLFYVANLLLVGLTAATATGAVMDMRKMPLVADGQQLAKSLPSTHLVGRDPGSV